MNNIPPQKNAYRTLSCLNCEGALTVTISDLWNGAVSCPYCNILNPLTKIANLNTGQLEYLAQLQQQGKLVSFDDYEESVERPKNSRITVDLVAGDFLNLQRPWYSLGVKRIGAVLAVLIMLALLGIIPLVMKFFMGRDVAIFSAALGALILLPFIFIAILDTFSNWSLTCDTNQLVWRRQVGPFKMKAKGRIDVRAIKDVCLEKNESNEANRYQKELLIVTSESQERLRWEMSLPEKRYLRGVLLRFLRSVSAPLLENFNAIPSKIVCSCGNHLTVTESDFWNGLVTCDYCQATSKLGSQQQLAPVQQEMLKALKDSPDPDSLHDYDDNAPPPTEPLIDEEGEPGERLVLNIHGAPFSLRPFFYSIVKMVIGVGLVVALTTFICGGFGQCAFISIPLLLGILVFSGYIILKPFVKEQIILTTTHLVRRRLYLSLCFSKKVVPLAQIRDVLISTGSGYKQFEIIKRCYLSTTEGTVHLGANADFIGAVYLRALVAKHLRAVKR